VVRNIDVHFRPTEQSQKPISKFSKNNKRLERMIAYVQKEKGMPVKDPKEVFLMLLSEARQGTERSTKVYQEIGQAAQDPDIKEALESRAWFSEKDLSVIDRCFELIGEKPVKLSGRVQEVFAEEFRKELAEIQNPIAKAFFLLTRASQLTHLRIAEFVALVAAADVTGHYSVGVLLESCLAQQVAFAKRTRRIIGNVVAAKLAAKLAGA
jgi:ferritin-like metal-binding protein YciE